MRPRSVWHARPGRGLSLVEVLVSSSVLLVLTGLAVAFLTPVWERTGWMEHKQDKLQHLVLLREYLSARLPNVWITEISSTTIRFYAPDEVETARGRFHRVANSETVAYDTAARREIVCETLGSDHRVVERVVGGRARVLWNLGPGGDMQLTKRGPDLFEMRIYGQDRPLHSQVGLDWNESLFLYLPGVNFRP